MRHATWTAIESSPTALRLYRLYRRLPSGARASARWLTMPRWQLAAALVRLAARNTVVAGPFAGMKLSLSPVSSRHHLGYVLGTQEMELREVIERAIARGHRHIINVGAADGYYAVGLARRLPQAAVTAFETLDAMHPVLKRVAALNGVEPRLRILGMCQTQDLVDAIAQDGGRTLIVADIEGGEVDLLDPAQVPSLRRTDILVETHDAFAPRCTEIILERFAATHRTICIVSRPRMLADFPEHFLPAMVRAAPRTALELMHERRTGSQRWIYMEAGDGSAAQETIGDAV